ncbi:unnamed protein product [Chrysodeixis includens]|uniref:Uncharacterized protein n=1 Tax=Chrysodeixis includens TaxID=689277 RepID=A0A9P0BJJ3_CHRIL|nr:unnamed protein product [Chrysodeixis includens]
MIYKNATELWRILRKYIFVNRCKAAVGEWLRRARRGAWRGDDAARSARHALLTWHAAAPPSLRWQPSQHSPGVVCALRKAVCRAACKAARRSRPECRTPPRRRPESVAYEEGAGTATGARAATPRSSTRSGAAGSLSGSASNSATRRCT